MNENNQNTQLLQNLVCDFEALFLRGEFRTFNKEEFEQLIKYYRSNNNIDKALEITELAIEQYQYITDFYMMKSELLLQNLNPEKALDHIKYCEELSPYSFEIKLQKVKALSMMGNRKEVEELLNELKTFSKLNYSAEFSIIYSYVSEYSGEYETMFLHLKDALITEPHNSEALERLLPATLLTRKYEESLSFHMQLINESPYNHLAWYNAGQIYSALLEYENAIDALEYSFIINPFFESGYLDYGDLCMQTGNFYKAAKVFEEYLCRFEADSEVYSDIIECYLKLKKFKQAKEHAYSSIKIDPFNDEVYYKLGLIYQNMGKWQKALNAFQKAMDIDEEREEYIDGIAQMYIKLKDLKKAEYYFDKLIRTNTPEEQYYISYIHFLIDQGKYNKAKNVIRISENVAYSPLFGYLEAMISFRDNNKREALLLLDDALSENPDCCEEFFRWAPELQQDAEIISIVKYYKD